MNRKLVAVYLVAILLASPLSSTVAVGGTVSGGVANAEQAGNAPSVYIPDATVDGNGSSTVDIAYNATGVADAEDLELRVWGRNNERISTKTDFEKANGTVTVHIPDHDTAGDYRISTWLGDMSEEETDERWIAHDEANVSVQSSVSVTDFSVRDTVSGNSQKVFAGEEFTLRTKVENDAASARNITVTGYLGAGSYENNRRTVSVAGNDEKIVSLSVTAPVNHWINGTWDTNVTVNDRPQKDLVVKEAPSVNGTVTDISRDSDDQLTVGDEANFTATVKNTDDEYGTETVTFEKDGEELYAGRGHTVYFPAGETETVNFSTTFESAGEHEISVGGRTITVTVEDQSSDTDDGGFSRVPEDDSTPTENETTTDNETTTENETTTDNETSATTTTVPATTEKGLGDDETTATATADPVTAQTTTTTTTTTSTTADTTTSTATTTADTTEVATEAPAETTTETPTTQSSSGVPGFGVSAALVALAAAALLSVRRSDC